MSLTLVKITHSDDLSSLAKDTTLARQEMAELGSYCQAVAGGVKNASVQVCVAETDGVAASGTVTISSGSGTITATINGVAIAITWATSDTNSATLLKNAINASANALVAGLVTATSALGVVTVTAANKGKVGNCVTLAASGTGATANVARLAGGVDYTYITYNLG